MVARKLSALILLAALLQISVQFFQIAGFRRNHWVPLPEVSALTFDAALLVATSRIAELALKAPVGTEGDEAAVFLPLISMQDLLYRTLQVVVAQRLEDTVKIAEGQLVRF